MMHHISKFQQLIINVFRGGSRILCVCEGAADRRRKGSNILLLPNFPKNNCTNPREFLVYGRPALGVSISEYKTENHHHTLKLHKKTF